MMERESGQVGNASHRSGHEVAEREELLEARHEGHDGRTGGLAIAARVGWT